MTTDAFPKLSHREVALPGGTVRLVGMAKGAGMICPNMATMLSVVLCDARVEASLWTEMLREAVNLTFNRVTVDGDTSTNDTLYGLANGCSGVSVDDDISRAALSSALVSVLGDLAYMLVQDGEGASKVARIHVTGAASDADCERVARTVGHSQLVKTALYGQDANWGASWPPSGAAVRNSTPGTCVFPCAVWSCSVMVSLPISTLTLFSRNRCRGGIFPSISSWATGKEVIRCLPPI